MTSRRPDLLSRLIWPAAIIVLAILWMVYTVGGFSEAALDLIGRGWPVLLVALGLMLLIGRRLRFGNTLSLGIAAVLVIGVGLTAYSRESSRLRDDYRLPIAYTLGPEVLAIRLSADLLATTVEVKAAADRVISGEFVGSLESLVSVDFQIASGIATLDLRETNRNAIPLLGRSGRGTLTLLLPVGLTVEQLTVTGREGGLTLDLTSISVKRLNASTGGGDINAQFGNESGLIGDLKTGRGAATVIIPPEIAAEIALIGPGADTAQFSPEDYTLRIDKVLVPKRAPNAQMQLRIEASHIAVR